MMFTYFSKEMPDIARPRINLTLNNSVADPGSGAFLPLDPGWVKSQDPDPG